MSYMWSANPLFTNQATLWNTTLPWVICKHHSIQLCIINRPATYFKVVADWSLCKCVHVCNQPASTLCRTIGSWLCLVWLFSILGYDYFFLIGSTVYSCISGILTLPYVWVKQLSETYTFIHSVVLQLHFESWRNHPCWHCGHPCTA